MSPPASRAALARRVRAFQDAALHGASTEAFEALALAIHRWQRAHSEVIAALSPAPAIELAALPAVPVDLFKSVPVGTVPPSEGVVFRTSGTTQGARGEHRLWDTALYDEASVGWARRCVPSLPREAISLLTDPREAPDSSLSHMVARIADRGASWHLIDGLVDRSGLQKALAAQAGPVLCAATSFALDSLLDGDTAPLPAGSVLMVTGGFKGRRSHVDPDALLGLARERLRPAHIATEYGMTELSSQLWGTPSTPYTAPPWLRVIAVDPATGAWLPPDARGQLRFIDLANVDSSLCIETMDEGSVDALGRVTLYGRLQDATPRGCSLVVEEALLASEGRA